MKIQQSDGFSLQNNTKNVDPSNKMDLDFRDCFGRKKNTVSYS